MNGKILKEFFILILLLIVVLFTLGMLFFDSINVDVQKIETVAKEEITDIDKIINEIDSNNDNKGEKINITKSVSREDLEKYRQDNSYNTGKKNPFSGVSDIKENSDNDSKNNSNDNTSKDNTSKDNIKDNSLNNTTEVKNVNTIDNNSNTIKEDTTGRFFENKTSK